MVAAVVNEVAHCLRCRPRMPLHIIGTAVPFFHMGQRRATPRGHFATRVVADQRPGDAFAGVGIAMLLDRSVSTVVPGGLFGGEVCRVQLAPVNVGALQFSLYFLDVLYAGDHGVAGMAGQALQQLGVAAGSSGVALVGGV